MPFSFHAHSNELLIDPHCHSKYSDGLSTPDRMFLQAKRRGLRGIVVTDHDTTRHWKDCLEAARKHEMITALGVEISTAQGHLLAYFPCSEVPRRAARYLKLDDGIIHFLDVMTIIQRVHDLGGVACIPHPFGPFYPLGETYMKHADGVEEYNSWIYQDKKRFRNALGFASRYHVSALGGSDSHYPYTLGFGATAIPAVIDFSKPDWFIHCIKKRLTRPVIQQKALHRRINFIKSTVSIPLNMRYNVKFFRSKWRGYWKQNYRSMLAGKPVKAGSGKTVSVGQ